MARAKQGPRATGNGQGQAGSQGNWQWPGPSRVPGQLAGGFRRGGAASVVVALAAAKLAAWAARRQLRPRAQHSKVAAVNRQSILLGAILGIQRGGVSRTDDGQGLMMFGGRGGLGADLVQCDAFRMQCSQCAGRCPLGVLAGCWVAVRSLSPMVCRVNR
jgi:hypothetical protein